RFTLRKCQEKTRLFCFIMTVKHVCEGQRNADQHQSHREAGQRSAESSQRRQTFFTAVLFPSMDSQRGR
uniref:Uncharacterized protein n=1 Tax=Stegastes partitus TaxID=144197 RepID=A0A3B5A4J8_9TELE